MNNDVVYRRHVIKSMKVKDGWHARSLRGKKIISPVCLGLVQSEAIDAVRRHIDVVHAVELASRGADGYPTASYVRTAVDAISISSRQNAMLAAHLAAPNYVLSASELAQAAGLTSYSSTNSIYGTLGRNLSDELEWIPSERFENKPVWTYTLATDADRDERASNGGHRLLRGIWRWKLRPEMIEALEGRRAIV